MKTEKEGMEARLTEELRSKDAAIENLRDVIANKSNEYTESLKKIKMQSALEAEELRRALIKEQDSLVARYQSALLVKDVFSAVELDRLKADKQSRIREIVRDYEGRISRSVLDSSERINELTSEFAQNQVTRQECSGILQGLLFSIESDYGRRLLIASCSSHLLTAGAQLRTYRRSSTTTSPRSEPRKCCTRRTWRPSCAS